MKKRVFIIHGWKSYPEDAWFPWLKKELEEKGFNVEVPVLPNPEHPKIEEWKAYISELVGNPDDDTFLIGHSLGTRAILGYLDSLSADKKIGGVILVAGWVALTNIEGRSEEAKKMINSWMENPVDWNKVRDKAKKFVAVLSDDDKFVPLEKNVDVYKNNLEAKIIIERGRGHFSRGDNIIELPAVLDELLKMAQ